MLHGETSKDYRGLDYSDMWGYVLHTAFLCFHCNKKIAWIVASNPGEKGRWGHSQYCGHPHCPEFADVSLRRGIACAIPEIYAWWRIQVHEEMGEEP